MVPPSEMTCSTVLMSERQISTASDIPEEVSSKLHEPVELDDIEVYDDWLTDDSSSNSPHTDHNSVYSPPNSPLSACSTNDSPLSVHSSMNSPPSSDHESMKVNSEVVRTCSELSVVKQLEKIEQGLGDLEKRLQAEKKRIEEIEVNMQSPEMLNGTTAQRHTAKSSVADAHSQNLWQFIKTCLSDASWEKIIRYTDEVRRDEFTIVDPQTFAERWGKLKNKESMTIRKLGRSFTYLMKQKQKLKKVSKWKFEITDNRHVDFNKSLESSFLGNPASNETTLDMEYDNKELFSPASSEMSLDLDFDAKHTTSTTVFNNTCSAFNTPPATPISFTSFITSSNAPSPTHHLTSINSSEKTVNTLATSSAFSRSSKIPSKSNTLALFSKLDTSTKSRLAQNIDWIKNKTHLTSKLNSRSASPVVPNNNSIKSIACNIMKQGSESLSTPLLALTGQQSNNKNQSSIIASLAPGNLETLAKYSKHFEIDGKIDFLAKNEKLFNEIGDVSYYTKGANLALLMAGRTADMDENIVLKPTVVSSTTTTGTRDSSDISKQLKKTACETIDESLPSPETTNVSFMRLLAENTTPAVETCETVLTQANVTNTEMVLNEPNVTEMVLKIPNVSEMVLNQPNVSNTDLHYSPGNNNLFFDSNFPEVDDLPFMSRALSMDINSFTDDIIKTPLFEGISWIRGVLESEIQ